MRHVRVSGGQAWSINSLEDHSSGGRPGRESMDPLRPCLLFRGEEGKVLFMKIVAAPAFALLLAGAAHAQSAPPQTPPPAPGGSNLTRDLNAGPPAPAPYLAPSPAPVARDDAEPEADPAAPVAPAAAPSATPAPQPRAAPTLPPVAPPVAASPRITPIPTTPAPPPRTMPITPGRSAPTNPLPPVSEPFTPPRAIAASAPTVPMDTVVAPAPPPPAAPAITVLDAAARAALPFSVDLPAGFEMVTGRPGPDFRIYTIRRGDRSFAMVYAGPASQFPIYSGQMVEAGGRASVVSTEDGVRHAQEHLFQRATAPREIHVWTMSLDGADRALAEQIAQSLDVR